MISKRITIPIIAVVCLAQLMTCDPKNDAEKITNSPASKTAVTPKPFTSKSAPTKTAMIIKPPPGPPAQIKPAEPKLAKVPSMISTNSPAKTAPVKMPATYKSDESDEFYESEESDEKEEPVENDRKQKEKKVEIGSQGQLQELSAVKPGPETAKHSVISDMIGAPGDYFILRPTRYFFGVVTNFVNMWRSP